MVTGRTVFAIAEQALVALVYLWRRHTSPWSAAAPLASKLVYGSTQPNLYPGLHTGRSLPLWATMYSLTLWWLIWSPTEETAYQVYTLPRIQALSRHAWVAVVVAALWWALQHSFIPLILDWRYVAWRSLAFLPGATVLILIYLRTRRLPR